MRVGGIFRRHLVKVQIRVFEPLVDVANDQVEEDVNDEHSEAEFKVILSGRAIKDGVEVDRLVLQLQSHYVTPTVAEGGGEEEVLERQGVW